MAAEEEGVADESTAPEVVQGPTATPGEEFQLRTLTIFS